MKERILSSAIVALGIVLLGIFLKAGMDNFTEKDRKVTVKGLAEKEVKADKVTWPIITKEIGDDLPELYDRIAAKQKTIRQFLLSNGIQPGEISAGAPKVIDMNAEQYSGNDKPYRYNVTAVMTVTSTHVDQVRQIIARQGDYQLTSFKKMKPKMMTEAIENAEQTAQQFAQNSHSKLNKIVSADQGQFSIDDRDANTPYIKRVRVVTTVTYSLKD